MLSLLVCLASSACPPSFCGTPGTNNCAAYNAVNATYSLQVCPASLPICPGLPAAVADAVSTCTIPLPVTATLYHGQMCTLAAQCFSGTCTAGFCVGLPLNTACSNSNVCANGLYCPTGAGSVCTATVGEGATCSTGDILCSAGYMCYSNTTVTPATNTCVKLYSMADYAPVSTCNLNSNPLCMSGQCATSGTNTTHYCIPLTKNNKSTPTVCTVQTDCVTSVNSRIGAASTSPCVCGYSAKGTQYCTLFPGDSYAAKAIASQKSWMKASTYANCNVMTADVDCAASQWTSNSDRSKYVYYYLMHSEMVGMVEADSCAVAIFYSDYAAAKAAYDKYGSASILALSVLAFNLLA